MLSKVGDPEEGRHGKSRVARESLRQLLGRRFVREGLEPFEAGPRGAWQFGSPEVGVYFLPAKVEGGDFRPFYLFPEGRVGTESRRFLPGSQVFFHEGFIEWENVGDEVTAGDGQGGGRDGQ